MRQFFSRFEELATLGEGGMGTVYHVRDVETGQEFALKTLLESLVGIGGITHRFRREFRAMAKLDHPNVVRVHNFFQDAETVGYTMDLVDGLPMNKAIKARHGDVRFSDGASSLAYAINIMMQLINALSYVHRNGLIHRDIKPSNVLVTKDDMAILTDFGLVRAGEGAEASQDLTATGAVMGTFRYIAPEQAQGINVDHRADIYSIGVMLYEILLNRHPFEGQSGMNMAVAHISQVPVRPQALEPGLSDSLDRMLMRCLDKEPFRRPAFVQEIAAVLDGEAKQIKLGAYAPTLSPTDVTVDMVRVDVQEASEHGAFLVKPYFVGRKKELSKGSTLLQNLKSQGFLLALEGESGIGKSRFMEEFEKLGQLKGIACVRTTSPEQNYAMLGTVAEVVRKLFSTYPGLLPEKDWQVLSEWLPEAGLQMYQQPSGLDKEQIRTQALSLFLQLLESVSRETPFTVVLDDVQWMDPESYWVWEQVIQEKIQLGHEGSLGLVISYRSENREEPHLTKLRASVTREKMARIKLEKFSEQETIEFVQQMLGQMEPPISFGKRIHQDTEGHPLFIEAVMMALVEDGSLYCDNSKTNPWQPREDLLADQGFKGLNIPSTIQEVLQRRIQGLSEPALKLLSVAACIGKRFNLDLLIETTGMDEDDSVDIMEKFLKRQLLNEADNRGDWYVFHHDKIREVVISELAPRSFRRIHKKILGILEQNPQWCAASDSREELAIHALHAESLELALEMFSNSGIARFTEGAVSRSHRLLRSAWQIIERLTREGKDVNFADQLRILKNLVSNSVLLGRIHDRDKWAKDYLELERQFRHSGTRIPDVKGLWQGPKINLDPALSFNVVESYQCSPMHEGLVRNHPIGVVVPALAESWTISKEGYLWTFQLRPDTLFHNGENLTAHDVKNSWQRVLHKDNPASGEHMWVFSPIKGANEFHQGEASEIYGLKVIDQLCLEIELQEPLSFFLSTLGLDCAAILPSDTPVPLETNKAIGAGPYRLKNLNKDSIIFERFEHYHDSKLQTMNNIAFGFHEERGKGSPHELMENGASFVGNLNALEMEELKGNSRFRMGSQVTLNTVFFGLRCDIAPFNNPDVRRAFCFALDRESLVQELQKERSTVANGILPPGILGYDSEFKPFRHSSSKAKHLLKEAGFKDGCKITIPYLKTANLKLIHEWCAKNIRASGFHIDLIQKSREELVKWEKEHGKSPYYFGGWMADYPDPDVFFYPIFHSSNQDVMGFNYANPDLDKLIEEARVTQDPEKRVLLYRQAQQLLVYDAPCCFLFHMREAVAWDPTKIDLPILSLVPPMVHPSCIFPPRSDS